MRWKIRDIPSALLCVLAFARLASGAVPAAPEAERILYESKGVKIYRTSSSRGTPVVVLTNLDADGNVLSPPADPCERSALPAEPAGAEVNPGGPRPPAAPSATSGETEAGGGVKVVARRGGQAAAVDEGDIEVTTDTEGGTTVIIHIDMPPAPPRETLVVPAPSYPVVFWGGLPGPYHYPDRLPFLGYGTGNETPVFFGGLGLSSTDRYARAAGRPCASGPGCPGGSRTSAP